MAFCQAACWESLISPRERTWRCTTLRPMRRLSTTDHERCSLPSFRRVPHLRNMPPVWRKSGGIKEGGSPLHALLKTVAAKSPANPHGRPRPTRRNLQTPFPVAEVGLKLGPDAPAEFFASRVCRQEEDPPPGEVSRAHGSTHPAGETARRPPPRTRRSNATRRCTRRAKATHGISG